MAIVLPVIAEKMHKPRVPVEEAVERCVIAKKYKIFRKFNWGFRISRPIEQFYAEWFAKPGPVLNYS